MAKERLTPKEREEWQKSLSVLRSACAEAERVLAEDDEAGKAAGGAAYDEAVKKIAKDSGTASAILAIRATGGRTAGE